MFKLLKLSLNNSFLFSFFFCSRVLVLNENDELSIIRGNSTGIIDAPRDKNYRIMQVSPCRCKIALVTRDGLMSIHQGKTVI